MFACYLLLLYSLMWSYQPNLSDSKIFDLIKNCMKSVKFKFQENLLKEQNVQTSKVK